AGTREHAGATRGGHAASPRRERRKEPDRPFRRRVGRVPSSRSGGGLVGLHRVVRPTAQRPATSRVPGLPSCMLGPPPFSGGRTIPTAPPDPAGIWAP